MLSTSDYLRTRCFFNHGDSVWGVWIAPLMLSSPDLRTQCVFNHGDSIWGVRYDRSCFVFLTCKHPILQPITGLHSYCIKTQFIPFLLCKHNHSQPTPFLLCKPIQAWIIFLCSIAVIISLWDDFYAFDPNWLLHPPHPQRPYLLKHLIIWLFTRYLV